MLFLVGKIAGVLAASCLACAAGRESVPIVESGAAKACIVLTDDSPKCSVAAAREFVHWSKELTGAEIPVVKAPLPGLTPITMKIDPSDAKIKYDGFRLTVSKDGISVVAREPFGIVHSAYWVLNRFGNIRWCEPESGADFKKTDALAIPAGVYEENPLPFRNGLRPGAANGELRRKISLWNLRNGFVEQGVDAAVSEEFGLIRRVSCGGHMLGDMVLCAPVPADELAAEIDRIVKSGENKKFLNAAIAEKPRMIEYLARYNLQLKKHPERLPLIDGVRCPSGVTLRGPYRGKVGNPCLSSISTRECLLEALRKRKAEAVKNAGGPIKFEVDFMCDDNSQWCECDECMKLITSKGASSKDDRASDYWWDFLNWITPRLLEDPDISVEAGIYLTYRQPPKRVKPIVADVSRQSILICPHGRCYFHSLTNAACKNNPRFVKMFNDWKGFGIPMRTFEYHCQLPGKGNYAFIEKAWIGDIKWYKANNISHTAGGLFGPWVSYYGKGTPAYNANPIYRYGAKARWQIINLTGHFSWDDADDFETVRRGLMTAYYRSAAKEMLEYRKLLEDALDRANICMSYGSSGLPFTIATSEPGLVEKALSLLNAADKAAGCDEELKRRIALDKFNFKLDWESAAAVSANIKAARLHRATGPVEVDGFLNEPTWKSANVSDDWRWMKTYNVDRAESDPFRPRTKMLLQCDNEHLYLAFACAKTPGEPEKDVPADGSNFDAMRGSHIEFVVQSPAQNGEYFHFAISHSGKTYSALTSNPSTRDLTKKCDFKFAINDRDDRWVAEIALPLSAFGPLPKEGEVWRVGAYRHASAPGGGNVEGLSTGFPLHWMDRWEAFSFGKAGNLVANPSFEVGDASPNHPYNGRNWKFRQDRAPKGWRYHHNGGDLDWRDDGASEGRRYIRVASVNANGAPSFIVSPQFALYPPFVKTLKISFSARGKGMIRLYSFAVKDLKPVEVQLDSSEWKRYDVDLPLCGTHPTCLTVRFASKGGEAIDFDDLVVLPADGR